MKTVSLNMGRFGGYSIIGAVATDVLLHSLKNPATPIPVSVRGNVVGFVSGYDYTVVDAESICDDNWEVIDLELRLNVDDELELPAGVTGFFDGAIGVYRIPEMEMQTVEYRKISVVGLIPSPGESARLYQAGRENTIDGDVIFTVNSAVPLEQALTELWRLDAWRETLPERRILRQCRNIPTVTLFRHADLVKVAKPQTPISLCAGEQHTIKFFTSEKDGQLVMLEQGTEQKYVSYDAAFTQVSMADYIQAIREYGHRQYDLPTNCIPYLGNWAGDEFEMDIFRDSAMGGEFEITLRYKNAIIAYHNSTNCGRALIVSAFPGTGKSYCHDRLCGINQFDGFDDPNTFNAAVDDSDSSDWSWAKDADGNNTKERHPEWPANYIAHIQKRRDRADIIFVSSHQEVRAAMRDAGIPFIMVSPDPSEKELYLQRYRTRGSAEGFVNLIDKNWWDWAIAPRMGAGEVILSGNATIYDLMATLMGDPDNSSAKWSHVWETRPFVMTDAQPHPENGYNVGKFL